ncbi:trimethylamine methyltransferase family protein [Tropicimonas sp. TH_r6]|uniref:trimethylamine methyltransferase family protein n=1 Tax=Tropicimonas sp. TH_r6 TaxID=3082085 RepID=UPI0029545E4C|nr:trimethylamine methyltransferase family protein [Tropicimonas sp. TH_r6]MDV7143460.1 trimethylamine methyltransferase family protein [Tropicimonas sp. TH_r6]
MTTAAAARPKTRRRRNVRAETLPNDHLRVPFITRGIPTYDILNEESLSKIEATAERILAEIGIEFRDDPETVALFRAAGGQVTGLSESSWNIRFEPGMIREILATAPERFTQHARTPSNSVEIGGDSVVFAPSYGSPFVMDLDRGRRYGSLQDFENLVKLGQSSPWLHHSGGTICEPTDVPVNKRHLDMVYAHIRYSDRAFLGSITAPERAEDSIAMARILFGEGFADENCVIMGNFNTTSPLVLDGVSTRGIRAYAAAGQASIHLPFLLGGAVAPLTGAGAVAQCLAESATSCALTQLVRPGAPTVLAGFLASMAMRSGSPTFGTPEPALASLALGQIARRWKLPLRCAGNFSTSKLPDAQAMQQSMMSMMSAIHCGANYVLHSAGFLDGLLSMSYEKFVLDTDLCGALHAYLKGLDTSEDALGFDALAELGPGQHLFSTQHTLRHYKTAFHDSELNDDRPWETWHEMGGEDMMTRANRRWKALLAEYEAPPLDPGTDGALKDFIARKKASMPDAWY